MGDSGDDFGGDVGLDFGPWLRFLGRVVGQLGGEEAWFDAREDGERWKGLIVCNDLKDNGLVSFSRRVLRVWVWERGVDMNVLKQGMSTHFLLLPRGRLF